MSKYVNILGVVRVAGKVFPGVTFTDGVKVELVDQACQPTPGAQTILFKDGDKVLAKINVSAVADVFLSDVAEEELALLEGTPTVEETAADEAPTEE